MHDSLPGSHAFGHLLIMLFQKKNRMRSPPSFVRIIDHTLGLPKYILGGT